MSILVHETLVDLILSKQLLDLLGKYEDGIEGRRS